MLPGSHFTGAHGSTKTEDIRKNVCSLHGFKELEGQLPLISLLLCRQSPKANFNGMNLGEQLKLENF